MELLYGLLNLVIYFIVLASFCRGKRVGKARLQCGFPPSFRCLSSCCCGGGVHVGICLIVAFVTAMVSACLELYTKNGMDTVTCPLVSMGTIVGLLAIFGGL